MSGSAAQTQAASRVKASAIDRVLFYVMVAVLCVRPLIPESFQKVEISFLGGGLGDSGPTPATTTWLDGLLLLSAGIALARRRPFGRRFNAFSVGWVLLALAVAVSVFAAGEKRVALNAGCNLLIGLLSGAALVGLMRERWMVALLLAAVFASGCTNAAKCITQRAYEFRDTREYWLEDIKPQLVRQGRDMNDPVAVNYERRLLGAESFGYFSGHPNLAASCLMMWLLAGLGVLAARLIESRGGWKMDGEEVGPAASVAVVALIVATLAIALWFTGSMGAFLAFAAGLAWLLIAGFARRWIAGRARRVFAGLAAGYVLVIFVGASYGVAKETLPHPSLAFRWHYWTAAARAFRDAPLTGLGRENFGAAFMKHKSAESTEEVKSPHNLWVSMAVELGPLGLLGAAVLAGALVLRSLQRLGAPEREAERLCGQGAALARWAPVILGAPLLHFAFSLPEFLEAPTTSDAFALFVIWAFFVAGVWMFSATLMAWVLDRPSGSSAADAWIAAGLGAAILAGFIHNLVGFSFLTPAGLTLLAVLAAVLCARRSTDDEGEAARITPVSGGLKRAGPWIMCLTAVAAYLIVVVVPTTRAEVLLDSMRRALATSHSKEEASAAIEWGRRAIAADPADAGPPVAVARALFRFVGPEPVSEDDLALLLRAAELGETALRRNPRGASSHRLLANIHEALEFAYDSLARPDDAVGALRAAVLHRQATVEAYPTNPRARISAGIAWFRLWQETEEDADAQRGVEHFREALAIDGVRASGEVMRLRERELAEIRTHLDELRAAGFAVPTTSAPASARNGG